MTDVLVNGPREVWIDRGRGLEAARVEFTDDDAVRRLAVRLAALVGRRLDDASPFVDARLPDGTRVHAVLGCLAGRTCLSLRVPARVALTLDDWQAGGGLTADGRSVLEGLVGARRAVLVSGGTGSGRRRCSLRSSGSSTPASACWWWRTLRSSARPTRTSCAWRRGWRTRRARGS